MKCDLVQLLGGNVIDKQFVFSVCQSATVNLISEEFCLLLRWNFLKQRNLKSVLKGRHELGYFIKNIYFLFFPLN